MKDMIKVGMADMKLCEPPDTITTVGLGSCVGIVLYDMRTKLCGMIHIMLPDSTKIKNNANRAKFETLGDDFDPEMDKAHYGLAGSPTHVKKSFTPPVKQGGMKIKEIRQAGMSVIPEDRMTVGCVNDLSVRSNAIADRYDKKENMSGIFLNGKKQKEITEEMIKEFEISCDSQDEAIRFLSGGNIQKVVVAREFTSGANFVIANQPTRGVDVGTAEMIRKYLVRMTREKGIGSLLISADLNEVLEVSDRLFVMRQGKIVAAFPKANVVDVDVLGEYMLGIKTMTAEEMEGLL